MKTLFKNERGLTLVELLLVMLLIITISVLGTLKWLDSIEAKELSTMQLQTHTLEEGISRFYLENSDYPNKDAVNITRISDGTIDVIKSELTQRGLSEDLYTSLISGFNTIDEQKIGHYLKTFIEDTDNYFFIGKLNSIPGYNNDLEGKVFTYNSIIRKDIVFSGLSSSVGPISDYQELPIIPENPIETPEEPVFVIDDTLICTDLQGAGTSVDPYKIYNGNELNAVRKSGCLNKDYVLMNDIDLSPWATFVNGAGTGWIGIGTTHSSDWFQGTFNGQGYKVKNLTINRSTSSHLGLFTWIGSSGTVRNLSIENANIHGYETIGILAAVSTGLIENCSTSGTIQGSHTIGGMLGRSRNNIIRTSSSSAKVTGTSDHVGGLVGELEAYVLIDKSSATGDVSGDARVGGLVGYSANSVIELSFATGNVSGGHSSVGGLVGYTIESSVLNTYARGSVHGHFEVGGLVGQLEWDTYISYSYATGLVSGVSNTGGAVGVDNGGEVLYLFYDRQTTGQSDNMMGIAATTIQMKQQATYTNWDFTNVWKIQEGISYPTFR